MIIDAVELERRYLQRIAGIRDKQAYIGPEVIDLVINNSCNLTCRYCWDHAPGNPAHFDKSVFFSWEKFLGIVHDAVELKVDQITIVGSGEPSIHPSFREMMRHLEKQPIKTVLFTNGTFPLEYCSDVIKGDHAAINLGAVDRQQYLDLQGKDLFDRVIANIKRLVALRDAGKPGFHVEIHYVVNAANVDQKQKIQELGAQLGVDSVYFKKMNVHTYNKEIALPEDSSLELGGEVKRTPALCLNGWFNMVVHSNDEDTSTCCRIPKMNLGDHDQWSLKQIWFSPQMMNMRLLGKYGRIQKMYKACQTCSYYDKNIQRAQALAGLEENAKAIT